MSDRRRGGSEDGHKRLWERYLPADELRGRHVHLTGLQALVRLPLDQIRRDRVAGRRVGAFFSGYPGSPLAGLDQTLAGVEPLLTREDVHVAPALNEELAASAVGGSQMLDLFPHSQFDGVLGLWYGKAPGLDRALDALRHSNFVGTSRYGGALALVGDDPFCKSSSLPSHSEHALAHAFVPTMQPSDSAEILELGRHAFAISRYAGLWVGMKIVADVADGGGIFALPDESRELVLPKFEYRGEPFQKRLDPGLLPPNVVRIEEELLYGRLEAVMRYAAANGLNPIRVRHERDRVGLVASGRLYRELVTALELLGLDADQLEQLGIRILQVQMLYPMEPSRLAEFADGLDEILVVDERRGFLEDQIRAALYNAVDRPMILGQRDEYGRPWIARHMEISAETVAIDLARHISHRFDVPQLVTRAEQLQSVRRAAKQAPVPSRTPQFCSGCPHGKSTHTPEGSVAGGGIGCHTMAILMDRNVQFFGAMGSEGAHWIGLSPFVDTPHLFQNLGDGTYCHSGRLAVRACVEAGVTLTFKLLYNGFIAMTGGQDAVGMKPLPEIVRDLLSDGVARVVVATTDPALTELSRNDARVGVVPLEDFDAAQRELRELPGVTVLVHDQVCSNQKQRLEKRGILPKPTTRIVINEDVCEGCGDCGRKATCASLRPTPTALGRKTRIHDTSCTDDRSCLAGDCPAFTSLAREAPTRDIERWLPETLPEPEVAAFERDRYQIFFVGVGSTGVVTIDAILMRAAENEGLFAQHLDQTGLAQRGGKVVSHCVLSRAPIEGSPRVSWGEADVLLAFDPLGASDSVSIRALDPTRTRAVVHEVFDPTGSMIANPDVDFPAIDAMVDRLRERTHSSFGIPAETLAEATLGTTLGANVILLGAALQRGLLPMPAAAIEQSIRDRDVAVESNLQALRLGRALVVDDGLADRILADATPPAIGDEGDPARAEALLGEAWQSFAAVLDDLAATKDRETLRHRTAGWASDLVDYQDRAYAERYLTCLSAVARAESKAAPESCALTAAAARELYRALAYKDEYEVARLLLRGPFRRWQDRRTNTQGRRYHLHPPLLRALGLERKLSFGAWVEPLLGTLVRLRRVRGTRLDPFGRLASRRAEREWAGWYEGVLDRIARGLDSESHEAACEIAALPGLVRGYEGVKGERLAPVRRQAEAKLTCFTR